MKGRYDKGNNRTCLRWEGGTGISLRVDTSLEKMRNSMIQLVMKLDENYVE